MITPTASRAAVMLILGGQGTAGMRRTLEAVTATPDRVWCAVPSELESAACVGHARTIVLDPWPGQRAALSALVAAASVESDDVVQTLVAGSLPNLRALRRSLRRGGRTHLVIPAVGFWRMTRPLGVRRLRSAILRPGAGMTLRGSALRSLAGAGWFEGRDMTVTDVRGLVGRIAVVRSSESNHFAARRASTPRGTASRLTVTVLIPAHNEQGCVGDTVRSVFAQTRKPDDVLVIDDGSTDTTGAIAEHIGARVVRTDGTGSKGAAINIGMESVYTDVVVLVDADTRLHTEAVHHLMRDMEAGAGATHGAVLPSVERGLWARGRLIEYATALRLHKGVQRSLGQIVVLSGCILAVRTEVLRAAGGFQPRTMVEDLDLTWTLHRLGHKVAYSPRAVAYPIEPTTWALYKAQMRRWSRGFFQAVRVHARTLHRTPGLAFVVLAAIWDVVTMPVLMAILLGLAAFGLLPVAAAKPFVAWQLAWTVFALVIAVSVIGLRRTMLGVPGYIVMSMFVSYFYFEAFVNEWVLRRKLHTWVKGH